MKGIVLRVYKRYFIRISLEILNLVFLKLLVFSFIGSPFSVTAAAVTFFQNREKWHRRHGFIAVNVLNIRFKGIFKLTDFTEKWLYLKKMSVSKIEATFYAFKYDFYVAYYVKFQQKTMLKKCTQLNKNYILSDRICLFIYLFILNSF